MRAQSGYTLLELLVVLVIMGLLAAAIPGVALPGLTSVRFSGKIEGVIYQLSADHEQTLETGRSVIVQPAELSSNGLHVTFPPGVEELVFFPDGSATGCVVSVGYLGRNRILTVDPITGRITSQ